jgi:hypothetical protein
MLNEIFKKMIPILFSKQKNLSLPLKLKSSNLKGKQYPGEGVF